MNSLVGSDSIVHRCASLGLTLARAQELATEHDANDPDALTRVLGLDTETLQPLGERRWVWMAAQAASVSYGDAMDELALVNALSTGRAPSKYFAHVCALFDEVPLQIVIMACSQVAQQSHITMETVWKNVAMLTGLVGARRSAFWNVGIR